MIPIQLRIKLDTEFETSLVMLLAVSWIKNFIFIIFSLLMSKN